MSIKDWFVRHKNIKEGILYNKDRTNRIISQMMKLQKEVKELQNITGEQTMSRDELKDFIKEMMKPMEVSEPISFPSSCEFTRKRIYQHWTKEEDNALLILMKQNTNKNNIQIAREVYKDFKRSKTAVTNRISILDRRMRNNDN